MDAAGASGNNAVPEPSGGGGSSGATGRGDESLVACDTGTRSPIMAEITGAGGPAPSDSEEKSASERSSSLISAVVLTKSKGRSGDAGCGGKMRGCSGLEPRSAALGATAASKEPRSKCSGYTRLSGRLSTLGMGRRGTKRDTQRASAQRAGGV